MRGSGQSQPSPWAQSHARQESTAEEFVLWICPYEKSGDFQPGHEVVDGHTEQVFKLPKHLPGLGNIPVETIDITEDADAAYWTDMMQQSLLEGRGFCLAEFLPPRTLVQTATNLLTNYVSPVELMECVPPLNFIQHKIMQLDEDLVRNTKLYLQRNAEVRFGDHAKQKRVVTIGLHIRGTDMTSMLHNSGEQSRAEIDGFRDELIFWTAAFVREESHRNLKFIIYVAADSATSRLKSSDLLPMHMQMEEERRQDLEARVHPARSPGEGVWPSGAGTTPRRHDDGLRADLAMLSLCDVFASAQWSSVPDAVRMVRGRPFAKEIPVGRSTKFFEAPMPPAKAEVRKLLDTIRAVFRGPARLQLEWTGCPRRNLESLYKVAQELQDPELNWALVHKILTDAISKVKEDATFPHLQCCEVMMKLACPDARKLVELDLCHRAKQNPSISSSDSSSSGGDNGYDISNTSKSNKNELR